MILYKYVTADTAIKIIKNKTLFFNNPHNWNDPFELIVNDPNYTDNPSLIYELLSLKFKYAKGEFTAEECLQFIENNKYTESRKDNLISNSIIGLSLSKKWNNLLMWAHYTDQHKGCVFEIDIEDDLFFINKFLYKVRYKSMRPLMGIKENNIFIERLIKALPNNIDNNLKDYIIDYSTKSKDWKYEKEWRLISLKKDADFIDKSHKCFFNIPPISIKAIFFGIKIERSDANEIYSIIKTDPAFNHIRLFQAKLNKLEFKIDAEPFDITNWFTCHEESLCTKKSITFFDKLTLYIFKKNSIFIKLNNFTIRILKPEIEKLIIRNWKIRFGKSLNEID